MSSGQSDTCHCNNDCAGALKISFINMPASLTLPGIARADISENLDTLPPCAPALSEIGITSSDPTISASSLSNHSGAVSSHDVTGKVLEVVEFEYLQINPTFPPDFFKQ